jgi:hypothetical protein
MFKFSSAWYEGQFAGLIVLIFVLTILSAEEMVHHHPALRWPVDLFYRRSVWPIRSSRE